MSTTLISTFCTGRFAPLVDYYEHITVSDWARLEATEVATMMPDVKLKMLAAVLHRKLESEGLFRAPVMADPFHSGAPMKILDWCQAVTSKVFPSHRTLEAAVHKVRATDEEANHDKAQAPTTTTRTLGGLDMIDLRYNNLMDVDMTDVLVLCKAAVKAGSKSFMLDLAGNRLSPDVLDAIANLCAVKEITSVFVPDIGHVGAKDQLACFADKVFRKLIFIRAVHLAGKQWHEIVPQDWWAIVDATHSTFYSQFPSFEEFRPA
jgi:hypothetical protein